MSQRTTLNEKKVSQLIYYYFKALFVYSIRKRVVVTLFFDLRFCNNLRRKKRLIARYDRVLNDLVGIISYAIVILRVNYKDIFSLITKIFHRHNLCVLLENN